MPLFKPSFNVLRSHPVIFKFHSILLGVRYNCLNFEKFRDRVLSKKKSGYIRTFRTLIVEHAIRPNADVKLAGYKAEFIFIPCRQLTFVLTHTRVSVVKF